MNGKLSKCFTCRILRQYPRFFISLSAYITLWIVILMNFPIGIKLCYMAQLISKQENFLDKLTKFHEPFKVVRFLWLVTKGIQIWSRKSIGCAYTGLKMEEGDHRSRNAINLQKQGKVRKRFSPSLQKGIQTWLSQ